MVSSLRTAFLVSLLAAIVPVWGLADNKYAVRLVTVVNEAAKIRPFNVRILEQAHTLYECLSFTNDSDRVVTAVRFRFSYVDQNRKVEGFDTLERKGSFEPRGAVNGPDLVPMQHYDIGMLERVPNCQHFRYPSDDIAYVVTSVDKVEFGDGTVWPSVQPSPSPTPSPTAMP